MTRLVPPRLAFSCLQRHIVYSLGTHAQASSRMEGTNCSGLGAVTPDVPSVPLTQ